MFLSQLRSWWPRLGLGGALVALALIASVSGPAGAGAEGANHLLVSGAGRTIIEGGTGGAAPVPVETVLAFHANSGTGAFECLALAPGAESGSFEVNAMYVTGTVSSATVSGGTAALQGVRDSRLGPPMVARALAIVHTCIYEAWAAYDHHAIGTRLGAALRRPSREHTRANKEAAISFAAYRAAVDIFPGDTLTVF